jgi:ABC-type branched-subunit amino acid transport system substrate-binding protein
MIDREGAVMLTGGATTPTALAVSALCQEKRTIFMAALTHGNETTGESCHKHTFRRYPNVSMSARALARTLSPKYGKGKWFHVTADDAWGHSVFETLAALVEPKGATTLKNLFVPRAGADFSGPLAEANAAKPDVLVVSAFGRDMIAALNQCAALNLQKQTKIVVPLVDEYAAKAAGANFAGVVSTAPFFWKYHADRYPEAKRFVDAFRERYGTPPSNGAECVYVNVYQYKAAAERAGTTDAAKVIAALENWHFTETREPEYWRAWDHQAINACLVVEGLPPDERFNDFDYCTVIDVHRGEDLAAPQSGSKCKLEPA